MKEFALTIPGPSGTPVQIPVPTQIQGIPVAKYGGNIIWLALELLLLAALLLSLFMLILGGFKWMTSSGNKQEVENARKTLVFAIVGLIIVFVSFVIINFLGGFFGVPIGVK